MTPLNEKIEKIQQKSRRKTITNEMELCVYHDKMELLKEIWSAVLVAVDVQTTRLRK